jgi:hypothetical protein
VAGLMTSKTSPACRHAPKAIVDRRAAGLLRHDCAVAVLAGLALLAADLCPVCAFESNQSGAGSPDRNERDLLSSAAPSNSSQNSLAFAIVFQSAMSAVSNWQAESKENLDLSSETKARLNSTADAPSLPRCVKLNNYWCVKRARWAGEIAADAEGHVAFATALDGAVAAAMLLRRYYVDYERRSALAIVSHWAPAQCGGRATTPGRRAKLRTPETKALSSLAPHGLQNTLRARWLSAHRRGLSGLADSPAPRRSIVPARPIEMLRAPEIALGMGESQRTSIKIAALDFSVPATKPGFSLCGDSIRIQNYALRAIEGVATLVTADLDLFPPEETSRTNLKRLLENMANVEIGPLKVRTELIAAAIERLTTKTPAEGSLANSPGITTNETARSKQ